MLKAQINMMKWTADAQRSEDGVTLEALGEAGGAGGG